MSALAHFLEDEGVPTVALSLIRLHSEKVGNPRSLWVPFELGRPLGPPLDAPFQTRVIESALGMLMADSGPVLLRDFDADDPTARDSATWRPPFALDAPAIDANDPAGCETALAREIGSVLPWHRRFIAATGRTTMGNSGLAIDRCVEHLMRSLAGVPAPSAIADIADATFQRFVLDDLKAFYLEAALGAADIPSSRQIQAWFWDQTVAARLMIALRAALLASSDSRAQAVGRMNVVPGIQVARLNLPPAP